MSATIAADRAPSAGYRLWVLALLIVVYTFNFIDRQILAILGAPIRTELGLSDAQFGLLVGPPFAAVYATLAVPVAWWADRWSRTWILSGSLAIWSGFTALCGLAGGFWSLFFARMGVGVGEAGGVAPSYSMIADYFPKSQRARALAAFSFGIPTGTALGILFGGLIAAAIDWRWAFFVIGLAGLAVVPIFRLTVRDPKRGGYEDPAPEPAPVPDAAAPKVKGPSLWTVAGIVGRKPSFWLMAFGAAFASINGYGVATWLPAFFMRSLGLTLVETSWFYAGIAFIGGVAGIALGGVLADRMGKRSKSAYGIIPAVSFVVAMPCFFAAMNSDNLLAAFLLFLIPTGLNLAWLGTVVAAVQHLVPATMRSTASALFLLINNLLGIAVGNYYFGAVSTALAPTYGQESMRYAIYSGLGFYVVATLLLLLASRTLKRDWLD